LILSDLNNLIASIQLDISRFNQQIEEINRKNSNKIVIVKGLGKISTKKTFSSLKNLLKMGKKEQRQ
jgi:hypothetical protein